MEKYITLIHAGIAVLMLLYLFVRLLMAIIGLSDQSYQERLRKRFRKPDWFFALLLGLSGLYPIVLLGQFELYHLIKLLVLAMFIWLSRYAARPGFAASTLITLLLVIVAGIVSFTDQPTFPKRAGGFEQKHPQAASLSQLDKGKLIFTTLCTQCHGEDGRKGRFGAADLTQSSLSLDQKLEIITKGSPLTVMRSFAQELSTSEIEAVAAYVHQLKVE